MNISNLTRIRSRDPQLAEALASIGAAVEAVALQSNASPQGAAPVPNAPPNLVVTGGGGVFKANVSTPPPPGSQYQLEYSESPNFQAFATVPMGAKSGAWSGALGDKPLHFRVRSTSLLASANQSAPVYHGSQTSPVPVSSASVAPTGVEVISSPASGGGGGGGSGFIPAPTSAAAPPVTAPAVTASSIIIDGQAFCKLHCTATAPASLGTFQGVIIALGGFQGTNFPQAISQLEYTGAGAGSIVADLIVPASADTVTVYFVAYNSAFESPADWTTAPNVAAVSLHPAITAPAAPSGLAATALTKCALLTWTGVTTAGILGYRVYRSTTNTFSTSAAVGISPALSGNDANGNVTLGQFRDDTAATGTAYFYWLSSIGAGPTEGSPTASVTVTPL